MNIDEIIKSKVLYQLKTTEIKKLRDLLLAKQHYKCAICGKDLTSEEVVSLDHQHKLKKTDKNGIDGNGLIRGVLCYHCNIYEGKIWNNGTRYKQFKNVNERIEFLKSLINYYNNGTINVIHPSEKEKDKKISKRKFNLLNKMLQKNNKTIQVYPKSGKLTKKLKILFDKYKIEPFL